MKVNVDLATPLKSKQAYAVKTYDGKWFTVYTLNSLNKVIAEGDFELITYRKIA
jgi:hypothetical protein